MNEGTSLIASDIITLGKSHQQQQQPNSSDKQGDYDSEYETDTSSEYSDLDYYSSSAVGGSTTPRGGSSSSDNNNDNNKLPEDAQHQQHHHDQPEVEFKNYRVSITMLLVMRVFENMNYAMAMPSLFPYIEILRGSTQFYGWCVSAFSLAQFISAPIIGIISNYIVRCFIFYRKLHLRNMLYKTQMVHLANTLVLLICFIIHCSPIRKYSSAASL